MQKVDHVLLDTSSEVAYSQSAESSLNEPDDSELLLSRNSLLSLSDEEEEMSIADVQSVSLDDVASLWSFFGGSNCFFLSLYGLSSSASSEHTSSVFLGGFLHKLGGS